MSQLLFWVALFAVKVYDGSKSYWKESDETVAINAYGKSKADAESYIQVQTHLDCCLAQSVAPCS